VEAPEQEEEEEFKQENVSNISNTTSSTSSTSPPFVNHACWVDPGEISSDDDQLYGDDDMGFPQ